MTEERRQTERRTTPPMVCNAICEPVDKKLESIWSCVKNKPSLSLFYWCLGGLGGLIVILLGFVWSVKNDLSIASMQMASLLGNVQVISTQIVHTNENLKSFVTLIEKENARQDNRIERLENKVEKR